MTITTDKLERQMDTITVTIGILMATREILRAGNTRPMDDVTDATRSLLAAMVSLEKARVELGWAHNELTA